MYDNKENNSYRIGINWKDLIIKIIMFVLFILLLVKLFPKVDLNVFYDSVYNTHVNEMKEAARKYYTVDRLPANVGDKSTITLKEMFDRNMLIEFTDRNGDTCDDRNSKVEVTKLSDKEYSLKVQLNCKDKSDFIIETIGCTSVCSNGTCTTIIDNGNNSNIGSIVDDNNNNNNNNSNNNGSNTENGDGNSTGDIKDNDYKITYTLYQHRKPVYNKKTVYTCLPGYTQNGSKCTKVDDGATIDATPVYGVEQKITTDAKVNKTGNYTVYADYIKTAIDTEYTCPTGYTRNGAYCIKYTEAIDISQKTCPTGYTLDGSVCVKEYDATYKYSYSCPNGGTLNGSTCTIKIPVEEDIDYTCPSGYTENGSSCYKVYAAKASSSSSCPSGYTQNGNKCVKTYNATSKVTCPTGYTKNGNNCVKTYDATGKDVYGSWVNQGTRYYSTADAAYTNPTSKLEYSRAITGAQCGAPCGNKGIWYVYTYYTRTVSTTYSCPNGGTLKGSTCTLTNSGTTSYSCPNGGTLSGSTCTLSTSLNTSKTYSCPDGGTLNGSTCTIKISGEKDVNYTCPTGYTKIGSNCIKEYNASLLTGSGRYTCPNGGTLSGSTCTLTTTPDIEEDKICPSDYVYNKKNNTCEYIVKADIENVYSYTCPSGYSKYGEGEGTICAKVIKGTQTYYCEDSEAKLEGTKCVKTVKGDIEGYTCPSGYKLNKDKCTKQNIITVDANKEVKTSKSYKYKWSESSSLEGWEFTGKTKTKTKDYTAGQQ